MNVQCCRCQRIRIEGVWMGRTSVSGAASHTYCPTCLFEQREEMAKEEGRLFATPSHEPLPSTPRRTEESLASPARRAGTKSQVPGLLHRTAAGNGEDLGDHALAAATASAQQRVIKPEQVIPLDDAELKEF